MNIKKCGRVASQNHACQCNGCGQRKDLDGLVVEFIRSKDAPPRITNNGVPPIGLLPRKIGTADLKSTNIPSKYVYEKDPNWHKHQPYSSTISSNEKSELSKLPNTIMLPDSLQR